MQHTAANQCQEQVPRLWLKSLNVPLTARSLNSTNYLPFGFFCSLMIDLAELHKHQRVDEVTHSFSAFFDIFLSMGLVFDGNVWF